MNKDSSTKQFSFVIVGNSVGTILQAGFYFIFAAILEPEEYGLLSYVIALAGTASVFSRFGLPTTVVVSISKNQNEMANQANVLALITTSIASIILIPININAALLCLALSFFVINIQNLLGKKEFKKYFLTYMIKSVGIIILPLSLYPFFGIMGILLGMSLGNFLACTNFFKNLELKANKFTELKTNFKAIVNNFAVDASISLTRSLDKLIIAPLMGLYSLAIFQFNLQILLAFSVLPLALYSYILPLESRGESARKIYVSILIISILVVLVVDVLSPIILPEIFPKFSEGIPTLQIMIVSIIPITINSIFTAKLQSKESTKVGYASIAKIIALLSLIVILGEFLGLIGLALAVLISYSIETVILTFIFRKLKL